LTGFSDIDLFLHVFRGLKSFRTAEMLLQGFVVHHNFEAFSNTLV